MLIVEEDRQNEDGAYLEDTAQDRWMQMGIYREYRIIQ